MKGGEDMFKNLVNKVKSHAVVVSGAVVAGVSFATQAFAFDYDSIASALNTEVTGGITAFQAIIAVCIGIPLTMKIARKLVR
jgi:hypothetical protein